MEAAAFGCSYLPPSSLGSIIKIDAGMPSSLLGSFGGSFGWAKNVFRFQDSNKILSRPYLHHQGAGQGGWEQLHLDVAS